MEVFVVTEFLLESGSRSQTPHQVSSFGQGSTSQQPPASEPSRAAAAARKSISHDPPPRRTLGLRVGRLLLLAALAGCCRVRGSGRPVPGPGSAALVTSTSTNVSSGVGNSDFISIFV